MTPAEYCERVYAAGGLTWEEISDYVRLAQGVLGVNPDGKTGPMTRQALYTYDMNKASPTTTPAELADLHVTAGWLVGKRVRKVPADHSWYPWKQEITPTAIVAHYTATDHGTAAAMARRRARAFDRKRHGRGKTSWHFSVEGDGTIWQMVPSDRGAWHARTTDKARARFNNVPPYKCAIGVELVGHGTHFPQIQVRAACRLWRALVSAYPVVRGLAMVGHSEIDPTRKADPGPLWTAQHADLVLDYAYAD